jgi:hypothetical protein
VVLGFGSKIIFYGPTLASGKSLAIVRFNREAMHFWRARGRLGSACV